MNKKIWYLYVLELEDKNWYVGITTDLTRRSIEHFAGKGAKWTRLHKPIRTYDSRELGYMTDSEAAERESYVTYLYVVKYGIKNVRGGFFTNVKLTPRYWTKVARKFNRDYYAKYGNGRKIGHPKTPNNRPKQKYGTDLAREQLDRSARLLGVYN